MFFNKVSPVNNSLRPKSRFFFFFCLYFVFFLTSQKFLKQTSILFFPVWSAHSEQSIIKVKASSQNHPCNVFLSHAPFNDETVAVSAVIKRLEKNPTLVICPRLHYDTLTLLKSKPSNSKCDNPVAASPCTHLSQQSQIRCIFLCCNVASTLYQSAVDVSNQRSANWFVNNPVFIFNCFQ